MLSPLWAATTNAGGKKQNVKFLNPGKKTLDITILLCRVGRVKRYLSERQGSVTDWMVGGSNTYWAQWLFRGLRSAPGLCSNHES